MLRIIINKKRFLLFLLPVVFFASCNLLQHRHQDDVIAETGGKSLTLSQINEITNGLDSVDSVAVADAYIKQWATDIIVYNEAAKIRSVELDEMADAYKRSLYLQEYERMLVARNMPKQLPDSTIESFYNTHSDRFILKETILKGIMLVFPVGTPKQDRLRKWLKDPDEDNLENIEKYMYQYGTGYELFLSEWRTANQVLMRLPVDADVLQQQLRRQTLIEVQDSVSVYMLEVTDKRFTGDVMPLELAKNEIYRLLITQKQTDFLREERDRQYNDAIRHGKIKIYSNKI